MSQQGVRPDPESSLHLPAMGAHQEPAALARVELAGWWKAACPSLQEFQSFLLLAVGDFLSLRLRQEAEEQVLISLLSRVYLKRDQREGGARFFSKVHIVISRGNQQGKRKSD